MVPTSKVKVMKSAKNELLLQIKKHWIFYIFLIPATVITLLFSYRPYIWLTMAFQDFSFKDGLFGSPFVGLQNFKDILDTPDFYRVLRNTIMINVLGLAIGFPVPILFALMINELRNDKFKRVTQTITYLPHFISWVIVAGLVYKILNEDIGIVNVILRAISGKTVAFLKEPKYFWWVFVLVSIWKEMGWNSIIYIAAMSGIDQELYDAATVDGATKLQKVRYITLPGIAPTIALMLILASGRLLSGASFEAVYPMRNPMINETAETIQIFNYTQGVLYNRYSYAAALDLAQAVVAFLLVCVVNYTIKKLRGYGLF
jgi:putative aldouronate transport system permease protein